MNGYLDGSRRRRPGACVDACQKLVEGKFDRGAEDVKAVVGVVGSVTLAIVHACRKCRSGVEHCRGTKVVGKDRWEVEGVAVVISGPTRNRRVLVFDDAHSIIVVTRVSVRGPGALGEFRGRLRVWLANGCIDCWRRLVDAKGELHTLDSARLSILGRHTTSLLLLGTLADNVGRMVALKVRRFELFNSSGSDDRYRR